MTPEMEKEIREGYSRDWTTAGGWCSHLLAEIDRLREKHALLVEAARKALGFLIEDEYGKCEDALRAAAIEAANRRA